MDDFDINGSYYVYSPNGKNEELTPLMYMIRSDNVKFVEFILKSDANPNTINATSKLSPLHFIFNEYLIIGEREEILIKKMISLLLSYGADINILGHKNETPLHRASLTTSVSIVEFLLENGADINAQDIDGKTALMYAVEIADIMDKRIIIRKLLDYGADLTVRDNKGKTVCEENTDKKIRELLKEYEGGKHVKVCRDK